MARKAGRVAEANACEPHKPTTSEWTGKWRGIRDDRHGREVVHEIRLAEFAATDPDLDLRSESGQDFVERQTRARR